MKSLWPIDQASFWFGSRVFESRPVDIPFLIRCPVCDRNYTVLSLVRGSGNMIPATMEERAAFVLEGNVVVVLCDECC